MCALLLLATSLQAADANWEPAGWGGGGFFYSAAFHPTRDGVIYMGGDVNGAYRSDDHGKSWKIINNGISGYGVFTIAVDPSSPETVWAATDEGLSKSTDAGESWKTIAKSAKKDLRLTGEKNKSIHNVAVDPTNGKIVYIGTPHGKIYKTTDGGETWAQIYQRAYAADPVASTRLQFGGSSDAIFGGFWMPVKFPATVDASDATGFGFSYKNDGAQPRDIFLNVRTSTGFQYRSRNLHDDFAPGDWRDLVLSAKDFAIDPEWKSKNADKAAAALATPEWATVNRFDFACVAGFESKPAVIRISQFFFAATKTTDGKTGTAEAPLKVTSNDLSSGKLPPMYGNIKAGEAVGGPIFTVAISPKNPSILAAASSDEGLLMSTDAGATWAVSGEMKKVASVAFATSDPNTLYAACRKDHVFKSTDLGKTWVSASKGIDASNEVLDVAVNPANADDVYAMCSKEWNGMFYYSSDGGVSWKGVGTLKPDPIGNPTLPAQMASGAVPISAPRNLAINPKNPAELFIAANWRSAISNDAGRTWNESSKGADISCVGDIRFHQGKVYAANMDEGVLVSDDDGANWKQLWPLNYELGISGHFWRLDIRDVNGATRIISASSPWDRKYNQVVISNDGGKTFKAYREGLPDFLPTANTMWGRGYARALAVDPNDPNVVYLGIDGDPSDGKQGGGVFKSTDGGQTWKQLENQPGSRRMFFGLAVDPTDSKRIYWGACGDKGGLYRTEDGGASWEKVYSKDAWIFNLHVTHDGTLYVLSKNIERSTDHGKTWKPLAKLPRDGTVVGFDAHPTDPNILWAVVNYWSGDAQNGGIYKTTDGGKTWTDITGNIPYRRPLVIRYNADTNELWAGFVGIYKLKQ